MIRIFAVAGLLWRLTRISEVALPEVPELLSLLGRAAPKIAQFITGLLNYLQNESLQADVDSLQNQVTALAAAWQDTTTAVADNFDKEASSVHDMADTLDKVGGAIWAIGFNQWAIWSRLRYNLMPNTIQYIANAVWISWVRPLRHGLVGVINWCFAWFDYLQVFVINVQAYARTVQVTGRNWRHAYVYPQLRFLLSPWRVAYWYQESMAVSVSRYLNDSRHLQTRDTVSRVVYGCMSRLWQSFDQYLVEWLLTDVSSSGWGSPVPAFPPGSNVRPPTAAPTEWEPFVTEPRELKQPSFAPDIPARDYEYTATSPGLPHG